MNADKITKQMIDFQKLSFENWFNAVSLVQDQTVSAMDKMLDQATWLPEDGRNAIQNWMGAVQDECDRFKGYVDSGFVSLEKTFTDAPPENGQGQKSRKLGPGAGSPCERSQIFRGRAAICRFPWPIRAAGRQSADNLNMPAKRLRFCLGASPTG